MRKLRGGRAFILGLLCLLGLGGASGAASAHVIFRFEQAGPVDTAPDIVFGGRIVATPEAVDRGLAFTLSNSPGLRPAVDRLEGLVALDLFFQRAGAPRLTLSLADLRNVPFPGDGYVNEIRLVAGPGIPPVGSIEVNTTELDVRLATEGGRFTGSIGSDGVLGCFLTRCDFEGRVLVAVPGPAGATLFGVGLLALLALRRR
jgi:hypothetical protein